MLGFLLFFGGFLVFFFGVLAAEVKQSHSAFKRKCYPWAKHLFYSFCQTFLYMCNNIQQTCYMNIFIHPYLFLVPPGCIPGGQEKTTGRFQWWGAKMTHFYSQDAIPKLSYELLLLFSVLLQHATQGEIAACMHV